MFNWFIQLRFKYIYFSERANRVIGNWTEIQSLE